jgi:hypothetical protein
LKALKESLEAELASGTQPPPACDRLEFIIGALGRYLNDEVKSLDEAFCVKRGKGHPENTWEYFKLARKIYPLWREMSWEDIQHKLAESMPAHGDDSKAKRAFRRFKTRLMAAAISKRMDQLAKQKGK